MRHDNDRECLRAALAFLLACAFSIVAAWIWR